MAYHHILIIALLPSVLSFYFYNPSTNQIISRTSTNNIPDGYKLLPAPKEHRRSNKGTLHGNCTDAGFTCTTPYPRAETFQFECDHDSQCPNTYKCCSQKCFEHKICSRSEAGLPPNGNNNNERPGTCEKWHYNCYTPYDYSLTAAFRCTGDEMCPRGFKCCEQSCFLHKICSRVTGTPQNPRSIESSVVRFDTKVTDRTTQGVELDEEDYVNEDQVTTTEEVTDEELEERSSSTTLEDGQTEENSTTSILPTSISIHTKSNVYPTVSSSINTTSFVPTVPDSNAIIPEYEEYYYHYGEGNGTEVDDEDYEDEDEEE